MHQGEFNNLLNHCKVSIKVYNSYIDLMCVNTNDNDFIYFSGLQSSLSSPYTSNPSFRHSKLFQRSSYSSHDSASDLPADLIGALSKKSVRNESAKSLKESQPILSEVQSSKELRKSSKGEERKTKPEDFVEIHIPETVTESASQSAKESVAVERREVNTLSIKTEPESEAVRSPQPSGSSPASKEQAIQELPADEESASVLSSSSQLSDIGSPSLHTEEVGIFLSCLGAEKSANFQRNSGDSIDATACKPIRYALSHVVSCRRSVQFVLDSLFRSE